MSTASSYGSSNPARWEGITRPYTQKDVEREGPFGSPTPSQNSVPNSSDLMTKDDYVAALGL